MRREAPRVLLHVTMLTLLALISAAGCKPTVEGEKVKPRPVPPARRCDACGDDDPKAPGSSANLRAPERVRMPVDDAVRRPAWMVRILLRARLMERRARPPPSW